MAHWQLTTLMGTGWVPPKVATGLITWGDDSTGNVLSYQLEDAVHQSNTMYNMALMSKLFHPLAESHGQASMEVEEDVSHTATLHTPQVQIRQWALPLQDSLAGLRHGHPIWEPGHPGFLWNTHGIQRYFTN